MSLSDSDKKDLLSTARSEILSAFAGKQLSPKRSSSELNKKSGVFVTLKMGKDLRGCIGYVEPIFPLAQAVQQAAAKAAFEDPRFMPLTEAEFKNCTIEISVLSALTELPGKKNIEIGKHGLVIDSGYRRGLLLPQVAVEFGWDEKQFLNHTALKAGLPQDAWKQKEVKLYTFTVEKFEEPDFNPSSMI